MTQDAMAVDSLWEEFHRTGDAQFRNQLIEHYLPLVRMTAERLANELPQSIQADDLTSAGTFGLMEAINNFDRSLGVKFETFCSLRIRGAMLDDLRQLDWVPRVTRNKAQKIDSAFATLEGELGRLPSDEEVADKLGMSLEELSVIRQRSGSPSPISLHADHPKGTDGANVRCIDILQDNRETDPAGSLDRKEVRDLILEIIRGLSRNERLVIILYYFEQLTMKQIGGLLNISESRVCQIHTDIILGLQRRLKEKKEELLTPPQKK